MTGEVPALALRFTGGPLSEMWCLVAGAPVHGKGWFAALVPSDPDRFGDVFPQVSWFRSAEECDGFVADGERTLLLGLGIRFTWAVEVPVPPPPHYPSDGTAMRSWSSGALRRLPEVLGGSGRG